MRAWADVGRFPSGAVRKIQGELNRLPETHEKLVWSQCAPTLTGAVR
jgi:hypothetical protein